MRKAQKSLGAKMGLKEMLAQHPEPKRNDWSSGRANHGANGDDGFPEYDPKMFEQGSDDEGTSSRAGGTYAILADYDGDAAADDGDWVTVGTKAKKKATAAGMSTTPHVVPFPAAAAAPAPAARQPQAAAGPSGAPATAPRFGAASSSSSGAGPSHQRVPYAVNGGSAGLVAPRAPRPPTHNADGRPLTDDYYQTFQKVYRNSSGAVCMRFHKTDVVTVRLNGDIVINNGNFKTRTTFLTIAEGLAPLGLQLKADQRGDWHVVLPGGMQKAFENGMELPAQTPEERGRGERLFAAYNGGRVGAPVADPGPSRPLLPTAVAAGVPAAAAASAARRPAAAAAAPSASWSYRAAATPAQPATAAAVPAAAAINLTPRTEASTMELAAVLDQALVLQGGHGPEVDEEHVCIACMAAPRQTVLFPCSHVVLCRPCTYQVWERTKECPVCREPLARFLEMNE